MTHAWCSDPARDAAVRAAEDGRDRPLPTLEEAIAAVTESMSVDARGEEMEQVNCADAAERSVPLNKKGEGQSGLRTERVTLEITHTNGNSASDWQWPMVLDLHRVGRTTKSVRVVEEPRGWLTDGERTAIEEGAEIQYQRGSYASSNRAALLRGLLARSTPPEVVLPDADCSWCSDYATVWRECLDAVRSSLAAAGVVVKEVGK